MVRLRPHHLLCILTYIGRGYTPAFTVNMTRIAERLALGEEVEIIDGPDDICAPLLDEAEPHCHTAGVTVRDAAAAESAAIVLRQPIVAGTRLILDAAALRDLRKAFATGSIRQACTGCQWSPVCEAVSASDYAGAVLACQA